MNNYTKMLGVARRAVSDACTITRQVQRNLGQISAITKDDKSPVTVADFAAQAIVGHTLRDAFGAGVHLVGEESSSALRDGDEPGTLAAIVAAVQGLYPDADEKFVLDAIDVGAGDTHHAGFWTLDPVDGTKGFLRNQQYAVALAYIEHGRPVVGVLGCPNLPGDFGVSFDEPDEHGLLYMAIAGNGAFEAPADDPGAAPVRVLRADHDPADGISVCASASVLRAAHCAVCSLSWARRCSTPWSRGRCTSPAAITAPSPCSMCRACWATAPT